MAAEMKPDSVLREKLSWLSGGKVLDVACGEGCFTKLLTEALRDYVEIIGIDADERNLEAARKNVVAENVSFQRMDAVRLGFGDGTFDTVAISNSLHHMSGPGQVLTEMKRVLKPGGIFIFREMYRDDQAEPQMTHVLFHLLRAEIDTLKGITHRRTYLRQELMNIVHRLQLQHPDIFDIGAGDADPKDAEARDQMLRLVDLILAHPADYRNDQRFKARAEELKLRVKEVGFLPANQLAVIGWKRAPSVSAGPEKSRRIPFLAEAPAHRNRPHPHRRSRYGRGRHRGR